LVDVVYYDDDTAARIQSSTPSALAVTLAYPPNDSAFIIRAFKGINAAAKEEEKDVHWE
jgi:hypothetical protein